MTASVGSRARAKQFRRMLKTAFPDMKFSVRCDTGTARNWISVTWEGGPSEAEVGDLLRPWHAELSVTRDQSSGTQQDEPEILDSDAENPLPHEARGRLTRANPFVLGMLPGEKPHLDVRRVRPFEAVLTLVRDQEGFEDEPDLTPREITSLSPFGHPVEIFCVPALVMADADGYRAGELVWIGEILSTVLDQTERVLVSRGDGMPLRPITTSFLTLI